MKIYVLGDAGHPVGPEDVKAFKKMLKEHEDEGTPIVMGYPVSIVDDHGEQVLMQLYDKQIITCEELKALFPKS